MFFLPSQHTDTNTTQNKHTHNRLSSSSAAAAAVAAAAVAAAVVAAIVAVAAAVAAAVSAAVAITAAFVADANYGNAVGKTFIREVAMVTEAVSLTMFCAKFLQRFSSYARSFANYPSLRVFVL